MKDTALLYMTHIALQYNNGHIIATWWEDETNKNIMKWNMFLYPEKYYPIAIWRIKEKTKS